MRVAAILAVLAAKRECHPELCAPVTWRRLKRVAQEEGVRLAVADIAEPASLVSFAGAWAVFISSRQPARQHARLAAHELAHLWLHVDMAEGRSARTYQRDRYDANDPREKEADYFAECLLAGAGVFVPWPDPPAQPAPARRGWTLPERRPAIVRVVELRPPKPRKAHRPTVPTPRDAEAALSHSEWLLRARAREQRGRQLRRFG